MKVVILSIAVLVGHISIADAGVIEQRAKARAECRQLARNMGYVAFTQTWKNSIKDCMIHRGFNGR